MATVLVTGGTGHLGRVIVRMLLAEGHRVRALARTPGADPAVEWVRGDLATGAGIPESTAGADSVVHAATWSPMARRGYPLPTDFVRTPPDVDVEGTRRLLDAARSSGVGHFLYVSIVGLRDLGLPYAKVKLQAEALVRDAGVPWSIVRGTAFYWLLDRMLGRMTRLPVVAIPGNAMTQPVDSDDFAAYVVRCLAEGPNGDRPDFAGPERLLLEQFVRTYADARGLRRRIVRVPAPSRLVRGIGALPAADAVLGERTWADWLRHHPA